MASHLDARECGLLSMETLSDDVQIDDLLRAQVVRLEVGTISVRISALTFLLDALCRDVSVLREEMARDVIEACLRACRDQAPNIARLARFGMFKVLRACAESKAHRLAALAVKCVVFASVEHESSDDDETRSHATVECRKALRNTSIMSLLAETSHRALRLLADGDHRGAARVLRPETMRDDASPSTVIGGAITLSTPRPRVLTARQRTLQDIQRARSKRLKADAEIAVQQKQATEETERREREFERRATIARTSYLTTTSQLSTTTG